MDMPYSRLCLAGFLFFSLSTFSVSASSNEKGPTLAAASDNQRPAARSVGIQGPTLGVLFNSSASQFRPILGVPGATTLGAPTDFGLNIGRAVVAPGQDYALAEIGEDREIGIVRFQDASEVPNSGLGVPTDPDLIVLSPAGTAAALYYRSSARIVVLTGLPAAPSPARELSFPYSWFSLGALAVSDDGEKILAVNTDGGIDSLFAVTQSENLRFVATLERVAALRFIRGTSDALLADAGQNRIYLIREAGASEEVVPLADESQGISKPVAVDASWDRSRVLVANSDPAGILVLDIQTRLSTLIPCACQPTGLHRLRGGSAFLLTEPSSSPLWLLDGDSASARAVFVPPGREALRRTEAGHARVPGVGGRGER
jgi:DNA-binding beta-propeller fold protein YncE